MLELHLENWARLARYENYIMLPKPLFRCKMRPLEEAILGIIVLTSGNINGNLYVELMYGVNVC